MNVLMVRFDGHLAVVLQSMESVTDRDLVLAWLRNNGHLDTCIDRCTWSEAPVTRLTLAQLKHPPITG